ncbi:MAG: ISNCY family transposase [Theionarchaea archaeon]|nr:ISNCY family transposase [Theionarchaea archaeon]
MRITRKRARELVKSLDETRETLSKEAKEMLKKFGQVYDFTEYEKRRKKVKERINEIPSQVRTAASMITIAKSAGRPKKLNLVERTHLFFLTRVLNKSNRDTNILLGSLLDPFIDVEISYKYIERLYSDEEVEMVFHNVFMLMLQKEGISGKFAGDGTGYSLLITRHYRTDPQKEGKDYRYAFRIIDVETGMYVGYGHSTKSEMDAFKKAMNIVKKLGITIDQISLDKYYSSRKVLKLFNRKTAVYVLPKKNISKIGLQWSKIFRKIFEDPVEYLKSYFQRNLSEAAFSADKRRFGWTIRQKREDRQDMAMFSIALLHNIFTVRVTPR